MKVLVGVLCAVLTFGIMGETSAELIGYWSFDEGKKNTVKDYSGNGYDGIVQGDIKWDNGKFGKAIKVMSADDRIEVSDSEKLDFQKFTATMWVQPILPATKMGSIPLIQKGGPGGTDVSYVFFMGLHNSNDKIYFIVADGAAENLLWSTNPVEADGKWHFIAGTYDGKKVRAYLDETVDEMDQTLKPQTRDDRPIIIAGGNPGGFNPDKQAQFDEVTLFDHALSKEEITKLMTVGPKQFLPVDACDKLTTTWGTIKETQ